MTGRRTCLLAGLLMLGGCSERIIVAASDEVLVVVEDIDQEGSPPTAISHFVLARPVLLSDAPADAGKLVARMRHESTFDCTSGTSGHRVEELTLTDGSLTSIATPVPRMTRPSEGSLGGSILKSVCDPDFRASLATRRLRVSIERDYLRRMSAQTSAGA